MNILFAIKHPSKGLIGLSEGYPWYPNEEAPNEFKSNATELWLTHNIANDYLKASNLQSENCEVVPVTISW